MGSTNEALAKLGRVTAIAAAWSCLVALSACAGSASDGAPGTSCTATDNGDGTKTVSCGDGSSFTVRDGAPGTSCAATDHGDGTKTISCDDGSTFTVRDGAPGSSCTATDNGDGTKTVSCDDGSTFTVRDGATGRPGLEAGRTPGLEVLMAVAPPANGTHFVAGESIVVTMTLLDGLGAPLGLDALATANLFMSGPRDSSRTRTAAGLLNASLDRDAADGKHHLVDLRSTGNANLVVRGNRLTYTLAPITSEESGTYTVGLNAVAGDHPLDQVFALIDLQLGTATVEPVTVGNCGDCHRGRASGQMYLHHTDPGDRVTGDPALDADPVRACKQCHNQEGQAAVRRCADGSIAVSAAGGAYACADGSADWSYAADSTVERVHGVHMGRGLTSPTNIDPTWGLFKDYWTVGFPADVRNCTACHLNDSWKTRPSRLACGSCHDGVDWTVGTNHDGPGAPGAQANDSMCGTCHVSASSTAPQVIQVAHAVPPAAGAYAVGIALTPAPTNGTFYADETPILRLTLTDAGGNAVDWATVTWATWNRAYFMVSGPRDHPAPALTPLAGTPSSSQDQTIELRLSATPDPRIVRAGNVLSYQLDGVAGLRPGTYTVLVRMRRGSTEPYTWAKANFQVGTATAEARPASGCTSCHGDTIMHGYLPLDDTDACKTCHDYALGQSPETRTGWSDSAYGYGRAPLARYVHQFHFGRYLTDTTVPHYSSFEPVVFPQDIRNCTTCHAESDAWTEKPSRLACTACHDGAATWVHASLQTLDPTPQQPYSGDELESCAVCHAGDAEFAPSVVHDVWDPYAPPYPR